MTIPIEQYDQTYFDGELGVLHPGGYSYYKRWHRDDSEYWKDMAQEISDEFDLVGKKVLELACAKGFVTNDMRDLGVEAYGVDCSQYAIDNAESAEFLTVADVRTHLASYADNEFDFVFSLRLLPCIPEEDLAPLIEEINRISTQQYHVLDTLTYEDYYLVHDLDWYAQLPFQSPSKLKCFNTGDIWEC